MPEEMPSCTPGDPTQPSNSRYSDQKQTPVVSGLIVLIHLFFCSLALVTDSPFRPNPPRNSPSLAVGPREDYYLTTPRLSYMATKSIDRISDLVHIINTLNYICATSPPELKLGYLPGSANDNESSSPSPELTYFEVMRVNVHITRLFFHAAVLDHCMHLSQLKDQQKQDSSTQGSLLTEFTAAEPTDFDIWEAKLDVANQLYMTIKTCSRSAFEANGQSAVSVFLLTLVTYLCHHQISLHLTYPVTIPTSLTYYTIFPGRRHASPVIILTASSPPPTRS